MLTLYTQYDDTLLQDYVQKYPNRRWFQRVGAMLFRHICRQCNISMRGKASLYICSRNTMQRMNQQFRQKKGSTNILAFAECDVASHHDGSDAHGVSEARPCDATSLTRLQSAQERYKNLQNSVYLGDLVLCYAHVYAEYPNALWCRSEREYVQHLLLHGLLHLLGFDHENDDDAEEMQRIESAVLHCMRITDPYHL